MATKKPVVKDPEESIEQALSKTELFFEKNGKLLLSILAVIAVVVGCFFGYRHFYAQPREQKATDAMFEAQIQFERDSFAIALNGVKGVFAGFDEVATEFSGTPQANIANHYAGICAMRMGDFQKAISYFQKYSQSGNAAGDVIDAQNYGLIGDCYIESGDAAKGVEFYKKAISASKSDATAPIYTQKAAIELYTQGKYTEALELFKSLSSKYPASLQARDADKFIALVEQKL